MFFYEYRSRQMFCIFNKILHFFAVRPIRNAIKKWRILTFNKCQLLSFITDHYWHIGWQTTGFILDHNIPILIKRPVQINMTYIL